MKSHDTISIEDWFTSLVRDRGPELRRIADRRVESGSDDLMQDLWALAWLHVGEFARKSEPEVARWLRASLVLLIGSFYRARARRGTAHEKYRAAFETDATRGQPDDPALLAIGPQATVLVFAFEQLSPKDQHLVRSLVVEGISYRELSEQLGRPESHLRKSLHLALKRLKAHLEEMVADRRELMSLDDETIEWIVNCC